MEHSQLIEKLGAHGKQLAARIVAGSLEQYNESLKSPRNNPTWSHREVHICVRLIQAGLSTQEIEDVFSSFPVGKNVMEQADPKRYFDALYKKSRNLVEFEKAKITIGPSLRDR